MAKTTHLHSRHRGTIPADQLAAGTPVEGDVIVWQSDGSMAWEAPASVEHDHDADYAITGHTHAGGGGGEILISDTPSTPLVFADLLQNEAEDDLLYG